MVYIDDVTTLSENTNTVKRNTEALLEASRELGLELNTKKTKIWSVLLTLTVFGNVAKLKHIFEKNSNKSKLNS
jgi:hypothetical protein